MASALQVPAFRLLLSCKVREGEGTWQVCGAALWRPERGGRRRGAAALESKGRRTGEDEAPEKGTLVIIILFYGMRDSKRLLVSPCGLMT
jgi:hypothetical protein